MTRFVPAREGSLDFFDRLEAELRAAAERRPRRLAGWSPAVRTAAAVLAAGAAIAPAAVPVLALLGNDAGRDGRPEVDASPSAPELPPVGTVMEPGSPMSWREDEPRRDFRSTVVATGVAREAGPWQMEVYESERLTDPQTGEEYQPAGLPCLGIALPDPPENMSSAFGGGCGDFPRTPGFSRGQMTVSDVPRNVREVLVYGRAPEEAAEVIVARTGQPPLEVPLQEGPPSVRGDFYLAALEPGELSGEVNWIDGHGRKGSRGIQLLPP